MWSRGGTSRANVICGLRGARARRPSGLGNSVHRPELRSARPRDERTFQVSGRPCAVRSEGLCFTGRILETGAGTGGCVGRGISFSRRRRWERGAVADLQGSRLGARLRGRRDHRPETRGQAPVFGGPRRLIGPPRDQHRPGHRQQYEEGPRTDAVVSGPLRALGFLWFLWFVHHRPV